MENFYLFLVVTLCTRSSRRKGRKGFLELSKGEKFEGYPGRRMNEDIGDLHYFASFTLFIL